MDYRKLNEVTIKDAYPLPRIDDSLDALSSSKWFSSIDLASGYWQVEMNPLDCKKTAFSAGSGLYEFHVMPFGLCNAPSTFERLMELVLAGLHWKTCLVYLDILIYARTFDEHVTRLNEIFCRLSEAGLKLKPKKCSLFQKEVAYLGHVVSDQGIATDPEKTRKVSEWPTLCNIKEVRSFIGLCSYYRRFIMDFATIAAPLHKLTHKNVGFEWTEECENSFQILKKKLTTSPILTFPDFSLPFILDTGASGVGIGAVLSQKQNRCEKVIAYASRKLSKTEQNYSVTKRELLAVVHAIKHFKHYLYGKRFTLRTDHGSLRWLYNFKYVQGQLARWLEILGSFNFDIVHRPGSQHRNADAMSRNPIDCTEKPCVENVNCSAVTQINNATDVFVGLSKKELRKLQLEDPDVSIVIHWKENNSEKPSRDLALSCSRETEGYWYLWNQLEMKDGVLYRRFEGASSILQVIVPTSLRKDVLSQSHNSITGGHFGYTKTIKKIQRSYYWLGCRTTVRNWVKH